MSGVLEPLAWLDHDWSGGGTLLSYAPVPAETKRMGEQVHDRLYGIETRSPLTPYLTAWRDVARHTVNDRKLGWPSEIGLWAIFGTEAWKPPENLIEEATQRQWRDEGQLSMLWRWEDDRYRLARLGLQLSKAGEGRPFRSFHQGLELGGLDIAVAPVERPSEPRAAIPFQVSGHLRERYNAGEEQKGEAIRFVAMGSAPLQPNWMMY